MKLTNEYLEQLQKFYTIAKGLKTGIFGDWPSAKPLVTGFSDAWHEESKNKQEAVKYLFDNLSIRAHTELLNEDELETLESCKKLMDDWQREKEAWRII